MKRLGFLVMAGSAMLVVGACKEGSVSGIGGGGAGGQTTSHSGSGSTGTGSGCTGDATTWANLTAGPIPCTQSSDCCVILNGCTSEAQIVSATNQAAAKAAWPTCPDVCNDCIPPAIQVGCLGGVCVGQAVPLPDASSDLLMDHCGTVPVGGSPDQMHFTCGGG